MLASLLLVTALGFSVARAEPARSEAPRVELIVEGSDEPLSARLVTALEAQLAELGVALVVQLPASSNPSGEQAPIAIVWIRSRDGTLAIQFFEPRGERLRVREVPVSGQDPVSIEEVSLIVRSYVEALLVTPSESRAEPKPSLKSEAEKQQRGGLAPQFHADVAFTLSTLASEADWQPGARLGAGVAGLGPFTLGVQMTLRPALVLDSDQVALQLRSYPFGLFASARLPLNGDFYLVPRLNAQVDIVQRRTLAGDGVAPADDETRASFVLGGELQIEWQLVAWGGLYVSAGADVVLGRYDYAISTPEGQVNVLSPQLVRPLLGTGFSLQVP